MVNLYDKLVGMMGKPMYRFFIKKEVGERKFRSMEGHLIPLLTRRLPDTHEVVTSLIMGYTKYKYQRGIKRKLKSVEWLS